MQGAWWGTILPLLVASGAQAQTTIDVAKISCEQFVMLKVGVPPEDLAIWLSGYYHGKRSDTLIEVQKLKDDAQKVRSYCLYNKGTLMEAVEKVLSAER
jgi:acid stress chaperone HdeB